MHPLTRTTRHSNKATTMTETFKHRRQKYRFIIAVTLAKVQNCVGGMKCLNTSNIPDISNVVTNVLETTARLFRVILLKRAADQSKR